MEAVEDDFLVPAVGSLVQTILESLRANKMDAWIRQVGLAGDIKGLVCEIRRVNMAVSDVRSMQLAESLAALKEVLYRADDVVDELDYYRLLQQVEGVTLHEPEGMYGAARVDGTSTGDDNILSSPQDDNILPRSGRGKKRAKAWGDYDEIRGSNGKTVQAKCKRCKKIVQYDSKQGTGVLIKHVKSKSCQNIFRASRQLPSPSSIDDATENATPVRVSNLSSRMGTDQEPTHITAAIAHPWNKDDISGRIQEITRQLKNIREDMTEDLNMLRSDSGASSRHYQSTASEPRLRTSRILQGKVYGRDEEQNSIIKLMTDGKSDSVTVLPIVGIGGIGKTALAQFVCADPRVQNQFDHIIWVWVSSIFDEIRVSREMLDVVPREKHEGLCSLDKLQQVLNTHIKSKRVLLVLDDVWDDMNNERWNLLLAPFKSNSANGNFILVTTRNLSVAKRLGMAEPVALRALGEEHFSSLFKARAFGNENYEEHEILTNIGREIAGKLKGNPLAAVTAGELLRVDLTVNHWRKILKDEDGKLLGPSGGIMAALKLSYDRLPYHLRQCFSYCSIFPDSYKFLDEELVRIWISQGFVKQSHPSKRLEEIGMDYLSDLVNLGYFQQVERSYFQQVERKDPYVMCDLMRDFARMVSRTECAIIDGLQCNDILPTVQHLSIVYNKDQHGNIPHSNKFEENLQNAVASVVTKLRSLVLIGQYDSSFFQSFQDIIQKAHSLRLLQISATLADIDPLVCSLVNPTHIRYLKLHVTWSDRDLLSKFCHLQLLDVDPYPHFHEPNLRFLKHLMIAGCQNLMSFSFEGLRQLRALETLEIRACEKLLCPDVLLEHTHEDMTAANCKALPSLVSLKISSCGIGQNWLYLVLQHVPALKELFLQKCPNLKSLELHSCTALETLTVTGCESLGTLEGLQSQSLRMLEVLGCPNLKSLELHSCTALETLEVQDCESLGTLEGLQSQSLRKLEVCGCPNLESLEPHSCTALETLAVGKFEWLGSLEDLRSQTVRNLEVIGCPNLESLELHSYTALETLMVIGCESFGALEGLQSQSLRKLDVSYCRNLKSLELHSYTALETLKVTNCVSLGTLEGLRSQSLRKLDVSYCQNLKSLELHSCTALETLKVQDCESLGTLEGLQSQSLRKLEVWGCPNLESLEPHSCTALETLTVLDCESLRKLEVSDCPNLESLEPYCTALETLTVTGCESLGTLEGLQSQSLGKLHVSDCRNLKSLELHSCTALETLAVRKCESLGALEGLWSQSLRELKVWYCRNLKSLELHSCTALETLTVTGCESLRTLEGLQSQSLGKLHVSDCRNLKSLELHSCTALETLEVQDCELLGSLKYRTARI